MKPANNAPTYMAMGIYPGLAELCRKHGYALAVHGSCGRDLDLVAIPWAASPSTENALLQAITTEFALRVVGTPNTPKGHGLLCTTLVVSFGECFIDLSIMMLTPPLSPEWYAIGRRAGITHEAVRDLVNAHDLGDTSFSRLVQDMRALAAGAVEKMGSEDAGAQWRLWAEKFTDSVGTDDELRERIAAREQELCIRISEVDSYRARAWRENEQLREQLEKSRS